MSSGQSPHMKTRLHNRVTGHGWDAPKVEVSGPVRGEPPASQWLCVIRINGAEWARAYGPSRSAASEAAATAAYNALLAQGY
ncbi:hypothetical protein EV121DRAFT_295150 [Schizophyllum commune]